MTGRAGVDVFARVGSYDVPPPPAFVDVTEGDALERFGIDGRPLGRIASGALFRLSGLRSFASAGDVERERILRTADSRRFDHPLALAATLALRDDPGKPTVRERAVSLVVAAASLAVEITTGRYEQLTRRSGAPEEMGQFPNLFGTDSASKGRTPHSFVPNIPRHLRSHASVGSISSTSVHRARGRSGASMKRWVGSSTTRPEETSPSAWSRPRRSVSGRRRSTGFVPMSSAPSRSSGSSPCSSRSVCTPTVTAVPRRRCSQRSTARCTATGGSAPVCSWSSTATGLRRDRELSRLVGRQHHDPRDRRHQRRARRPTAPSTFAPSRLRASPSSRAANADDIGESAAADVAAHLRRSDRPIIDLPFGSDRLGCDAVGPVDSFTVAVALSVRRRTGQVPRIGQAVSASGYACGELQFAPVPPPSSSPSSMR